jgi:hypothetical protein
MQPEPKAIALYYQASVLCAMYILAIEPHRNPATLAVSPTAFPVFPSYVASK